MSTARSTPSRIAARHQAWPLSQGTLDGRELTCGLHHWRYDACTGAGINPAGVALRAYAVRIADGEIWVDARWRVRVHAR